MQTLFFAEMRHRPTEPHWPERDRFVLSRVTRCRRCTRCWRTPATSRANAAHAAPPRRALQGHPANFLLPGIEASTGSLGQGLSSRSGWRWRRSWTATDRVYCMIGDGESQEGQIWEAAMSAPKFKLDNLCVILDHNRARSTASSRTS